MPLYVLYGLIAGAIGWINPLSAQVQSHTKTGILMGSSFEVTAVSENKYEAWEAIDTAWKEIERIESLISSWDQGSETSEINRQAGIRPVKVSRELFDLISRAQKVSALTEGAFDLSFASMDQIWRFDGSMESMPDSTEVARSVSKINYSNILLDQEKATVFLKEKGMKIGFGAIGKGYAANRAKKLMQEMGIEAGLVNAGGDLIAWGKPPEAKAWRVGIANPKERDALVSWLWISELAVVTSGDYERFVEFEGQRYAHIIDPKTGYPVQGLKSVSIVCPDAELADALATAVFVLGKTKGLELVSQLKGIECLLITDQDEMLASKGLQLNYYSSPSTSDLQNHMTIGQ